MNQRAYKVLANRGGVIFDASDEPLTSEEEMRGWMSTDNQYLDKLQRILNGSELNEVRNEQ